MVARIARHDGLAGAKVAESWTMDAETASAACGRAWDHARMKRAGCGAAASSTWKEKKSSEQEGWTTY
jgi:hypothetical protein